MNQELNQDTFKTLVLSISSSPNDIETWFLILKKHHLTNQNSILSTFGDKGLSFDRLHTISDEYQLPVPLISCLVNWASEIELKNSLIKLQKKVQRLELKLQKKVQRLEFFVFLVLSIFVVFLGFSLSKGTPQALLSEDSSKNSLDIHERKSSLDIVLIFEDDYDLDFEYFLKNSLKPIEDKIHYAGTEDIKPFFIVLYIWSFKSEKIEGLYNSSRYQSLRNLTNGNTIFVTDRQYRKAEQGESLPLTSPKADSGLTIRGTEIPFYLEFHHKSRKYHDDTFNQESIEKLVNALKRKWEDRFGST